MNQKVKQDIFLKVDNIFYFIYLKNYIFKGVNYILSGQVFRTSYLSPSFKIKHCILQVPSVIDYIRKKAELYDLKKNVKICTRRNKIQEVTIISYLYQSKSIL